MIYCTWKYFIKIYPKCRSSWRSSSSATGAVIIIMGNISNSKKHCGDCTWKRFIWYIYIERNIWVLRIILTDFIVVLMRRSSFRSARFRFSISTDFFLLRSSVSMSKADEISSKDNENKYLWALDDDDGVIVYGPTFCSKPPQQDNKKAAKSEKECTESGFFGLKQHRCILYYCIWNSFAIW